MAELGQSERIPFPCGCAPLVSYGGGPQLMGCVTAGPVPGGPWVLILQPIGSLCDAAPLPWLSSPELLKFWASQNLGLLLICNAIHYAVFRLPRGVHHLLLRGGLSSPRPPACPAAPSL